MQERKPHEHVLKYFCLNIKDIPDISWQKYFSKCIQMYVCKKPTKSLLQHTSTEWEFSRYSENKEFLLRIEKAVRVGI